LEIEISDQRGSLRRFASFRNTLRHEPSNENACHNATVNARMVAGDLRHGPETPQNLFAAQARRR